MRNIIIFIASLAISSYSAAALHIRDLDGDWSNGHEGVYDDVLNITWMADANLAKTNDFSVSGIESWGDNRAFMSWFTAHIFADTVNNYNGVGYLSVNNWRLPTSSGCLGFNCGNSAIASDDELGFHFYQNFGATAGSPVSEGTNDGYIALFSNISPYAYWLGTEQSEDRALYFDLWESYSGQTDWDFKTNTLAVWLVADGDHGAAVVPIPASAWLFSSALCGLIGFTRVGTTKS